MILAVNFIRYDDIMMTSKNICSVISLLCVLGVASGCTAVGFAVGAGAKTGVEAAKEGGLSRAVSDFTIQTQISNLWFQHDVDVFRKLDLTINQGRVLITGVVQNSQHRVDAVRLAWQPRGVKQVINEIRVAKSEGVPGFARDVWITTQLRTKMTLDKDIQSINYSIDTVQGTVYLMGVAQNQNELNKAIDQARTVSGVKEVVSYVKFAGQPLTQETLNQAPIDPTAPSYNNYQGSAPQNIGQPVSPYSKSPEGLSPLAQPEEYVPNRDLPPPGQWANGDAPVVSQNAPVSRAPVQVYPLND